MIQLTPKVMEAGQQREIREWLRQRPALLYRQHLLDLAAVTTAQAAKLLLEDDEASQQEGRQMLQVVKQTEAFVKWMETNSADDYTFSSHELKPFTATITEEYANTADRHRAAVAFPGSGNTPDPRATD